MEMLIVYPASPHMHAYTGNYQEHWEDIRK